MQENQFLGDDESDFFPTALVSEGGFSARVNYFDGGLEPGLIARYP